MIDPRRTSSATAGGLSADPAPMTMTGVEPTRGRGRLQVYVDGIAAFDISREGARDAGLRRGRSIDEGEIEAIVAADARRRALAVAAAMLARRPHSEHDVRSRLAQRRFAPELAGEIIARLHELHLLDDAEFARSWAESRDRTSPRGRRLMGAELRAHGVQREIAVEAVAEISEEDAAYRLASRRARSLDGLDYSAFRSRISGLLQRRGFVWETIGRTIDRCWRERSGLAPDDDLAGDIE